MYQLDKSGPGGSDAGNLMKDGLRPLNPREISGGRLNSGSKVTTRNYCLRAQRGTRLRT